MLKRDQNITCGAGLHLLFPLREHPSLHGVQGRGFQPNVRHSWLLQGLVMSSSKGGHLLVLACSEPSMKWHVAGLVCWALFTPLVHGWLHLDMPNTFSSHPVFFSQVHCAHCMIKVVLLRIILA